MVLLCVLLDTSSRYEVVGRTISNRHFTSVFFTTLHFSFFSSLYSWTFRHHTSTTFHFSSLIITYQNLFLKMCDLQWKVACAPCSRLVPQFDRPIYKGVCSTCIALYALHTCACIPTESEAFAKALALLGRIFVLKRSEEMRM